MPATLYPLGGSDLCRLCMQIHQISSAGLHKLGNVYCAFHYGAHGLRVDNRGLQSAWPDYFETSATAALHCSCRENMLVRRCIHHLLVPSLPSATHMSDIYKVSHTRSYRNHGRVHGQLRLCFEDSPNPAVQIVYPVQLSSHMQRQ